MRTFFVNLTSDILSKSSNIYDCSFAPTRIHIGYTSIHICIVFLFISVEHGDPVSICD